MTQEKKIKIKVIKRSAEIRNQTEKKQDKVFLKKSINKPVKGAMEPEKKKTMVTISVAAIMLIIFITWISLLGHSLSRIKPTHDNFWTRLENGLKDDFAGIKNSLEGIKKSVNLNSSQSNDNTDEENIFPQIK